MRQVFSSPRLENVEGIARMLEEQGIEVRITHGRSYKGGWSGRRSYRDAESGQLPAVWVVRSEDQPRARQLLREAGLLDSTRASVTDSYLAPSVHVCAPEPAAPAPQRRAFRYKIALLVAIGVAVALAYSAMRRPSAPPQVQPIATTPSAPAPTTVAAAEPAAPVYRIDTPPALAETLVVAELDAQGATAACVAIDSLAPPADTLARLSRGDRTVEACAAAPAAGSLVIDVRNYRTDGSGTGTIDVAVTGPDAAGRRTTQVRTLQVRRVEADWRVLRVISVR